MLDALYNIPIYQLYNSKPTANSPSPGKTMRTLPNTAPVSVFDKSIICKERANGACKEDTGSDQHAHVTNLRVRIPGRHEPLGVSEVVIGFLSIRIEYAPRIEIHAYNMLKQMAQDRPRGSAL